MKKSFQKIAAIRSLQVAICLTSLVGLVVIAPAVSSSLSETGPATQTRRADRLKQQQVAKTPRAASGNGERAPLAPTITATLQDSFTDGDGDMKAEPGQTVSYTVTITPSVEGATGVAYNQNVDTHTTLDASSIKTTPVARPDSYNAIGNVLMNINTTATGVLNNDSDADPGQTATLVASAGATSTNGANVVMNANGTFTYNPPRGFEGTDTFTYTLTDSTGKTDTGVVSVAVADVIWFIDNTAAAGGDGRLTSPYNSIGAFQAVNNGTGSNPQTDDLIFIYRQMAAADYVGSLTLLNDQMVIGQGASQSIITIGGLTTPSGMNQLPATMGTAPNLTTTAAATNAINVGQNNFIRGVTLGNTTGADIAGSGFGTLAIGPASGVSDVVLNGNGQALSLTNGALAARIASVSSTNSAGVGILLDQVGGSLLSGATTIANPTGIGIDVKDTGAGTSSVNIDFANTSVTQSGGTGVNLATNTGTITFADLDINPDDGQRAMHATNNTGTITITSGTITTTTGVAVEITSTGTTPLNITLTSVSVNGAPSGIVIQNNSGSFTVSGDGSTTGGVLDRDGSGGSLTNTTSDAVRLTSASNVTLRQMNLNSPGDTVFVNILDNETATGEHGVEAIGGSNIILSAVLIDSPAGSGMIALNLTGTSRLNDNSLVTNINSPQTHGLFIRNTNVNNTLFEVNNTDFTNSSTPASILNAINDGTANLTVEVENGCIFEALSSQAVTMSGGGTAGTTGTLTSLVQNSIFRNATGNAENNVAALVTLGATHNATIEGNTLENIAKDGTIANTSIIRTQNTGGKLPAIVRKKVIQNIAYGGVLGGRHVIGHVFETLAFNAANFSNLRFEGNTATNITYTATNREFIFIDYRDLASGGDIKILGNNWNMPTAAATSEAIELRFRQNNASTVRAQVDNNGQGTGAISNTGTRFFRVDAEESVNLALTVTNNRFTNNNGAPGAAIEVRTEDNAAAGGPPTACFNITGNNVTAAGNAIVLAEVQGTMNITQASTAAMSAANNAANVTTPNNAPTFGQPACALPSNAPTKEDAADGSPAAIQLGDSTADKTIRPEIANIPSPDKSVEALTASYSAPVSSSALSAAAYAPLRQSLMQPGTGFDQSLFSLLRPATYVGTVIAPQVVTTGEKKYQKKADTKLAPQGGGTVSRTIGDIPQNKTVTITFDVIIDDPAGVTSISTQGTVSGTNFSNKLTNDPDTPAPDDPTVTQVDLVDTSTSVVADDTSVTAGDLVTFTATIARVSGSAGTITGTVQFKEDGNNLGSPVAVTGSGPFTAQLMTRCLAVGSHTITAVYSGDSNFKTSTGTLLGMQSVVKPMTVQVDDSFAGSADCQDLGSGNIFGRTAFATIAAGQAGVAAGGTVNVADGTYAENVTVAMDTVTLAGNLQIIGLSLSGGTFNSTSGVLSSTGNFNRTGGTFNTNSGTLAFTGLAAQTLGGTIDTQFNNLTINNSAGVNLGANATVNGTLALTTGDLNTGAFTLTMPGLATSTGITDVIGNVKRTGFVTGGLALSFGNPLNTIRFDSGTPPTDVNVHLIKAQPPGSPDAVSRTYTITPTGGSGYSATLRLRYVDSEIGILNESTFELWRFDGATWVSPAGSAARDTTQNWVEETGISEFSPWTIADASGPTLVELISFTATSYDDGILLEWRTGMEVDNLGFNLYREQDGKRSRVNSQLVAGSALLVGSDTRLGSGHKYGWWDGTDRARGGGGDTASLAYWLEDVDLKGQSTWRGPFYNQAKAGMAGSAALNAKTLAQLGSAESETRAPEYRANAAAWGSTAGHLQLITESRGAIKLRVKREAWYRVSGRELIATGINPDVDPRALQLFVDGKQQPVRVIGEDDGRLDADDTFEFYGVGIHSPYTDLRTYYLVEGKSAGLRVPRIESPAHRSPVGSFQSAVERRDRFIYFAALRNGDDENFFGSVVAGQPVDQTLTLKHLAQPEGIATLSVALQGVTEVQHLVTVSLNGASLGQLAFEGRAREQRSFSISSSLLTEGVNTVTLAGHGGPSDVSLVDNIGITYQRSFTADDNALKLTAQAGQQLTIEGFTNAEIQVFDVTDPQAVREIGGHTSKEATGAFSVSLIAPSGNGQRSLLALTQERGSSAAAILEDEASTLRTTAQGADLVIVSNREMFGALAPLIDHRQKQGLSVMSVDIEDIYDEFSMGNKTPYAVRQFLEFARLQWKKKPRFVLLAGDASYDPKDYLALGASDLVPTKLIDTSFMETGSDDWLADFDNDGVADLGLGRLPVRTPQDASLMVSKIIASEKASPCQELMLVADENDGFDFEAANDELASLVPPSVRVIRVNRGRLEPETAKKNLLDGIYRGQKLVNYIGHGSVNHWRGGLLVDTEARALVNERLPVFVMMTCLNGYFHNAISDSLAESLLKAERGGAVAVWASSGMAFPDGQAEMTRELFRRIFAGAGARLGDAVMRAKSATADRDVRRTWILFGDPAMQLK